MGIKYKLSRNFNFFGSGYTGLGYVQVFFIAFGKISVLHFIWKALKDTVILVLTQTTTAKAKTP